MNSEMNTKNKNFPAAADKLFQRPGLKLMTHIVAGYPNLETSERLVEVMVNAGADMLEIQIPFTDPLADGPVIALAGQTALEAGVTPEHCFQLARRLSQRFDVPILIMTYANIACRNGLTSFLKRTAEAGSAGVIIPDLPFDECPGLSAAALEHNLYAIPVVSPGMRPERLDAALLGARGFVYATLRVGITGARLELEDRGLAFLREVQQHTPLPVVAGFGVSSPAAAQQVGQWADGVVAGSHVINLFNQGGLSAVGDFVSSCKKYP